MISECCYRAQGLVSVACFVLAVSDTRSEIRIPATARSRPAHGHGGRRSGHAIVRERNHSVVCGRGFAEEITHLRALCQMSLLENGLRAIEAVNQRDVEAALVSDTSG